MSCCKILKTLIYFIFVLAATFSAPVIFYLSLENDPGTLIYYIAFNYTSIVLAYVILDSLVTVIRSLKRVYYKRRSLVWNYHEGKYQTLTNDDINQISSTSSDLGEVKHIGLGIVGFTVSRPDPTCLMIIQVRAGDNLRQMMRWLNDLHSVPGMLHVVVIGETLQIENGLLLETKVPITVLNHDLNDGKTHLRYVVEQIKAKILPTMRYSVVLNGNQSVERYSLTRALAILQKGETDIIQGRSIVSNNVGFLEQMIAIEYNLMYGLYYKGKEVSDEEIIVGSSNCWMRTNTLVDISDRVPQGMKIDFSLLGPPMGHVSRYHSSVVIYETCPKTTRELWDQRVAWTQEWIKSARFAKRFLCCSQGVECEARWDLGNMLFFKEVVYYPTSQTLPTLFVSLLRAAYMYNFFIFISSCAEQMRLVVEMCVMALHLYIDVDRSPPEGFKKIPRWKYLVFIIFRIFYGYFKFLAVIWGHVEEIWA